MRITDTLHENLCKFITVSRRFLLRIGYISDLSYRKIQTHILS